MYVNQRQRAAVHKLLHWLRRAARWASEQKLIVFDRRVIILVTVCVVAFALLVTFKLHGSSDPMWNQVFGTNPSQGLVLGSPKVIRSDEWYATMPMVLSQAARGYPVANAALGSGASPLLLNVPVAHMTTLARPHFWGYFLLGPERGFSWYWWSKVFGLFLGSFVTLMLLTKNRFWLSLFGATWLMASTFTQWWFSTTMPEMLAAGLWLFVAGAYVLLSRRRLLIIAASLVAVAATVSFALTMYPPHQIPIAYLVLALAIGLAVDRVRWKDVHTLLPWRIAALILAIGLIALLGVIFWHAAQTTILTVSSTVYPGQRRTSGGGVTLPIFMIGTYSVFLNQNHFPATWAWANVVELSGFLLLWPLAALGMVRSWFVRSRPHAVELALLVFCVLITLWMTIGAPAWLEHITLFDHATNLRALVALGPASIFLCVTFLATRGPREEAARTLRRLSAAIVALATFLVAWLLGLDLAATTSGIFSTGLVFVVSFLLAVLAYAFFRHQRLFFAAGVLIFIVPASLHINPLSRGLTPLTTKNLYATVREVTQSDPDARWVVYDNDTVANFIKAAGALVVNGVQYAPDHALMSLLDPTGTSAQVWNRYARINFIPDANSHAKYQLTSDASYNVTLNPCSAVIVHAGIKYIVFVAQVPRHIECLRELTTQPVNDARIFTRR